MKATCTNCSKVFKVHLKERDHPNGIEEHYFRCTHCKKRYTSFVTDDKVRQMQRDMQSEKNDTRRLKIAGEVKKRMDKLKSELTKQGKG